MSKWCFFLYLLLVLVLPVGCMNAADHQRSLGSTQERYAKYPSCKSITCFNH